LSDQLKDGVRTNNNCLQGRESLKSICLIAAIIRVRLPTAPDVLNLLLRIFYLPLRVLLQELYQMGKLFGPELDSMVTRIDEYCIADFLFVPTKHIAQFVQPYVREYCLNHANAP
jgi:hypothetical protein